MSAATRAKSSAARATIMLGLMRRVKALGNCRAFDDCAEMGDGDDVVAHIIKRAHANEGIAALVRQRGFGYWLERGYLARMTTPGERSTNVEEAIALQDQDAARDKPTQQVLKLRLT